MTRNDFFKHCATGMCCCAAVEAPAQSGAPEADELRRKLEAVHVRFAKLVGVLNQELDPALKKRVLESLGRACAREYSGLIDNMAQKQWMEKAEYDERAGAIRIIDKSRNCTCPLVSKALTPGDFCECTLGWQKEAYTAIVGKPVEAELEESVLRGGSRCVFRIRIL